MPELGYWQVNIRELRVADQIIDFCADGTCRAVFDTGTSLLAVPKVFTSELSKLLTAPGEAKAEVPVACANSSLPEVTFVLEGGPRVSLLPADYARQPMRNGTGGSNTTAGPCRP